eukprot:1148631-Pelagomonas_calceolata.AAC.7
MPIRCPAFSCEQHSQPRYLNKVLEPGSSTNPPDPFKPFLPCSFVAEAIYGSFEPMCQRGLFHWLPIALGLVRVPVRGMCSISRSINPTFHHQISVLNYPQQQIE